MDFQPMSPDEIQRMMQFLLNHQAQFAADMTIWDERLARLSAKTDQISDSLLGLTSVVGSIAVRVSELAGAQKETDRQLKETDRRLNETDRHLSENAQLHRETDEHLNRLIEIFERHLRDDHGVPPS